MTLTSVSNARKPATWHAIVLISDALTVTIMDTSQRIGLTKYHLQAHQHNAGTTPLVDMTDQHLRIIATPGIPTVTIETGTDSVDLNPAHITLDIGVTAAVILTEAILDHFTSPHAIALHAAGGQAHTATTETHQITDPHHAAISPDDSRSRTHKTNRYHYKPTQRSSSSSQSTPWKLKDRRNKQVTIDDPPSEYYSSHEQDSDLEDDLN